MPVAIAVIGTHLDRSDFRHHPVYTSLIPVVCWVTMALATVIPAVLIMRIGMSLPRWVGLTVAVWVSVVVELYLIFISGVAVH